MLGFTKIKLPWLDFFGAQKEYHPFEENATDLVAL
jgi:hypothetical protein